MVFCICYFSCCLYKRQKCRDNSSPTTNAVGEELPRNSVTTIPQDSRRLLEVDYSLGHWQFSGEPDQDERIQSRAAAKDPSSTTAYPTSSQTATVGPDIPPTLFHGDRTTDSQSVGRGEAARPQHKAITPLISGACWS